MLNIGQFARLAQVSPRMLRHYDETGLLRPAMVDAANGYRLYSAYQLAALHRIVAMRDLGFRLHEIAPLIDDDIAVEKLRSLLKTRQAALQRELEAERGRLRRVEAHLRALEAIQAMSGPSVVQDIVVKTVPAIRVAESSATVAGYGTQNISPVFANLAPKLGAVLARANVRPGLCIGYYESAADGSGVTVHVAFDTGDQELDGDEATVTVLPAGEVASVVHRGGPDGISVAFERLYRWVEDGGWSPDTSGARPDANGRELYYEWHPEDHSRSVTELQVPVVRA